jgi:hypothetical protein
VVVEVEVVEAAAAADATEEGMAATGNVELLHLSVSNLPKTVKTVETTVVTRVVNGHADRPLHQGKTTTIIKTIIIIIGKAEGDMVTMFHSMMDQLLPCRNLTMGGDQGRTPRLLLLLKRRLNRFSTR